VCQSELIWGADHTYEDYGVEPDEDIIDSEGIVSNLTCTNDECEVETILIYRKQ
jgi:hypothetical protein